MGRGYSSARGTKYCLQDSHNDTEESTEDFEVSDSDCIVVLRVF